MNGTMYTTVTRTHTFPGLTNYEVPIPGTDITCYLGRADTAPTKWVCSLWAGEGEDDYLIAPATTLDFDPLKVSPEQVARVAFLLAVEYGEGPKDRVAW